MRNLQNNLLWIFVLCILLPSTFAITDNVEFNLSSCGDNSVLFDSCGIFSGQTSAGNIVVPSQVSFIVSDTISNSVCVFDFGLSSGSISSVSVGGVNLALLESNTFAGAVSITANTKVIISGSNFEISQMQYSCNDISYSSSITHPTISQESKAITLISNPVVSHSQGNLIENHSFSVDSLINWGSMQYPDFCVQRFATPNVLVLCDQPAPFESYQIVFSANGPGVIDYSLISELIVGTEKSAPVLQNSQIEIVSNPDVDDVAIPRLLKTSRGQVLLNQLQFGDTIFSTEVACPSASSVSLIIGNPNAEFNCEFFSNSRLPSGKFLVSFDSDSLISNSSFCSAPFTLQNSGLYTIEGSCNYNSSASLCSGMCLQPLPSILPSSLADWLPWFDVGRTFFDFFGDNEVPDCVCSNGQLEPISSFVSTETISIVPSELGVSTEPRVSLDIISPTTNINVKDSFTLVADITCESVVDCVDINVTLPIDTSLYSVLSGNISEELSIVSGQTVRRSFDILHIGLGPSPVLPSGVPFISVWNTSLPGESNSNQITLPVSTTIGGFGNHNFIVDWGDGTTDVITSPTQPELTHTYAIPGVYTVTMTGDIDGFGFGIKSSFPFEADKLVDITQWGDVKLLPGFVFSDARSLTVISATDTPDLSHLTSLWGMFRNAKNLQSINNFENWDLSTITDVRNMFGGADSFNQDINGLDVSNIENMHGMFYSANSFNQDLNSWNVSSVINMSKMFNFARSFNGNISDWDTSSVIDMNGMFLAAWEFNQPLNWDTSSAIGMRGMFQSANVFSQDLTSWDVDQVTTYSNFDLNSALTTCQLPYFEGVPAECLPVNFEGSKISGVRADYFDQNFFNRQHVLKVVLPEDYGISVGDSVRLQNVTVIGGWSLQGIWVRWVYYDDTDTRVNVGDDLDKLYVVNGVTPDGRTLTLNQEMWFRDQAEPLPSSLVDFNFSGGYLTLE